MAARLRTPAAISPCHVQLEGILQRLQAQLPDIQSTLRQSIDRADERAAFSLELLDLNTWSLRPLAATLNFSLPVEPSLVRFTLRLTALTTVGVLAFKLLHLPHGYWLPFTMVVVLQPDYGATRQRAAQRVLGTASGSVVASALLWLQLPMPLLLGVIAASVFIFSYTVRRHYAFAVFFVTLFVVLLMEASGPITAAVVLERVCATAAGGVLALGAAAIFWPLWESERFPPIMARALQANADYLKVLAPGLISSEERATPVTGAKQAAEAANAAVFASLRRMFGDPKNRRERVQQAAALANGNQRLTRIFNVLFVHLGRVDPGHQAQLSEFAAVVDRALRALADRALRAPAGSTLSALRTELDRVGPSAGVKPTDEAPPDGWLSAQFARAATEVSAMTLSAEDPEVDERSANGPATAV